ncbi:MAG: AAA-like domain-containing protein [Microcystaceae cyanobacterium]
MKPKNWDSFLTDITIDYGLKGKLKDLFMVRFAYENWRKPDTEVWELAQAASHETYKKQMTELYRNFASNAPNGCPELNPSSKGPGKFNILREWLKDEKYPEWEENSPTVTPQKNVIPNIPLPSLQVTPNSIYINRPPIESNCLQTLTTDGALIRIKAPEKMGKTSLLRLLLNSTESLNYRKVYLNLQGVESSMFSSLDKFLRWFSANISRELGLKPNLDDYWDEELFGSLVSCKTYFQSYILEQNEQPLVLGLDNIDRLFEYPDIAKDFLPMLRFWHEEANNIEVWQNLRIIIANSTEAYIKLDANQSPFNVGRMVKLTGFSLEQLEQFAQAYQLNRDELGTFLPQLENLLGGHPYLSHLALEALQKQQIDPDTLLTEAPTQGGIYAAHLRRHWNQLQSIPALANAMKAVVNSEDGVQLDPAIAYQLESMGLIVLNGDQAQASCQLYLQYFRDNL